MSTGLLPQSNKKPSADSPVYVQLVTGGVAGSQQVHGVGAFGDLITAPLNPAVQVDFVYGGHDDMVHSTVLSTGSVAYANAMSEVTSGGSIGGYSSLESIRVLRYRPGQGALFRFTALFSEPVEGCEQVAGALGGSENELVVGYDPLDSQRRLGFNRKHNGIRDMRTYEVTTPAGGGGSSVVVTLDSVVFNISVASGTAAENAQEISENTFTGWHTEADGDYVHFLADFAEAKMGTFSVTGSGAFATTGTSNAIGVSAVDDWVYQEDWNMDKFDGTGPSGQTIDPSKGNVYEIRLQYLGFGAVDFLIEDEETGAFVIAHRYKYANANVIPSSSDPTYAMGTRVSNVSSATSVTVKMASMFGAVEGARFLSGPNHGADSSGAVSSETPVLSLRNNIVFIDGVDKANLRDIFPSFVSVAATGSNKPLSVHVVINAVLTNPLWETVSDHGISSIDSSATGFTGGTVIFSTSYPGDGSSIFNLAEVNLDIRPGDILSLVLIPTGTAADYTASITWEEDT